MRQVHDGKPIPPEQWGKDHFSTMLYIETRCVDHGGSPAAVHMRTCAGRPNRGDISRGVPISGDSEAPTRLAGGVELHEHDDWDCAEDFVAAGLLVWENTGANPIFKLTDRGWWFAQRLRRERAERNKEVSLQNIFLQSAAAIKRGTECTT